MRILALLTCFSFILNPIFSQSSSETFKTPVLTLGVFHFAYPNLDVVKIKKEDQISVLDEPFQSEIIAICNALETFKPTAIAVEVDPSQQSKLDSLYKLYLNNEFTLKKDELFQLAFRIGKNMNIPKIHCVNDWGKFYADTETLFADSARRSSLEQYMYNSPDSAYEIKEPAQKVKSVVQEIKRLNQQERIKNRLGVYLLNPFKYEENPGDFVGVDFEMGRWFSRNLRIFRNVQRIERKSDDRILVIMGAEHLNLLDLLIDASPEYEHISAMPYLEQIKM